MESQPVQSTPVVVKEKLKSRPAVVILSALLILTLAGVAVLGYLWAQENQKANDTQKQLTAANKKVDELNAGNVGAAKAAQDDALIPNFGTFNSQYGNFLNNSAPVDQTTESVGIEAALKSYYKLSSLPSGWAVLSIYQIVKPETPPTGDYYALVYWPKSDQKPAGFISLYKQKGGEWKYNDQL